MNNYNFTTSKIDFLNNLDKKYKIDQSEKYFYINLYGWNTIIINTFLSRIRSNDVYLIFPFITTTKRFDDPYLRLSSQFLVTNESNPKLISDFLEKQWNNCGFEICEKWKCLIIY